EFMSYIFEQRFSKTTGAKDFLAQSAETLRLGAEEADRRLRDYQKRHDLVSLDNSTNLVRNRLIAADQARMDARLERLRIDDLLKQVDEFIAQNRDMLEISYISNHGSITAISTRLAELRKNETILSE